MHENPISSCALAAVARDCISVIEVRMILGVEGDIAPRVEVDFDASIEIDLLEEIDQPWSTECGTRGGKFTLGSEEQRG